MLFRAMGIVELSSLLLFAFSPFLRILFSSSSCRFPLLCMFPRFLLLLIIVSSFFLSLPLISLSLPLLLHHRVVPLRRWVLPIHH